MPAQARTRRRPADRGALRCRRKFLRFFPDGFADETYVETERTYKWKAHLRWREQLGRAELERLLAAGEHAEVAQRAVRIESGTNLLFSFEKMALRDAVRPAAGARAFAEGVYELLHGDGTPGERFDRWVSTVGELPRRQTRVLTWPLATVFGFIAQPRRHFFLKPRVTQRAFEQYGLEFTYRSRPSWETYSQLLALTRQVAADLADLKPRDMIDIQGFLWVQGSDEYEE